MKIEDLIEIGFKESPHYTVTNSLDYDLGRGRFLSIGCLATPNEMVFIYETDDDDDNDNDDDTKKITNLVCLRNYDYDGYTTLDDIKNSISSITKRVF